MSAVGASYVAIYHQTTQQIPARKRFQIPKNAFKTAMAEDTMEAETTASICSLPPPPATLFHEPPCRPAKQICLAENVNCKHIKIYCWSLPHQEFMNLKPFFYGLCIN